MRRFEAGLDRLVAWIVRACELLTIALGGWLVIALVAGVFFRYVLNNSLTWVDESSSLLLVWLMLVVTPIGFHQGFHIAVNVVVDRAPRRARMVLGLFSTACSMLLFAIAGWYGLPVIVNDFDTQLASIPMMRGWFTFILPVACVAVLLVLLNNAFKIVRRGDLPESTGMIE